MTNDPDPRIQRLAGEAEYAAAEHDPGNAVTVDVVREPYHAVVLTITASIDDDYQRHTYKASALLALAGLDELLRDLSAARASLMLRLLGNGNHGDTSND